MFARVIEKVRRLAESDPEALSAVDDFLGAMLAAKDDWRARGTMLVLVQSATDVPERSATWAHEEGLT
jgi:hypothetical protein